MNSAPYSSVGDTLQHIQTVRLYLGILIEGLEWRATQHDASKLESPEKEALDALTPRLQGLTYGSDEYRATLREMKPALEHHYANNSHHPEFHPGGVAGMDLLDLVEMLADWKAASLRHADGDILTSLEHNVTRFGLEPQLASILRNTIVRLGWNKGADVPGPVSPTAAAAFRLAETDRDEVS